MLDQKELKRLQEIKTGLEGKRQAEKGEVWEKVKKYVLPELKKPGDKSTHYSTTAQRYTTLAANALQGWAYGRTISWLNVEPEDKELQGKKQSKDEREWFQQCGRIMLDDLAKADFYDESLAFTQIVFNMSTGILLLDWDEANDSFVTENVNPERCVIAQDKFHRVNLCMYEFELDKQQAESMFGDDCPQKIRDSKSWTDTWTFVKAMVSAKEYDFDIPGEGEWMEVVWCADQPDKSCSERRTQHKPFLCWRFERSLSGSPWGCNSPGERCIADIVSLNVMEKSMLKGIQLREDPPIMATEGLKLNITPAGVTRVKGSANYSFTPPPGNSQETINQIMRVEQNLKEAYYVDFFLMLQQTLENNKTATEATLLADEKSQIMSSFTSRLNNEFLEVILETLWEMEISHGRFPEVPQSLAGSEIRIDYVSPLAIAQRKAQTYAPARNFIADTMAFAQIDPSVQYIFKLPEYADAMAKDLMIDERFLNSPEEVQQKVQEQQQMAMRQMQAQQQNQDAQTQAGVYNALSKAPEPGSAASQLMGGQ